MSHGSTSSTPVGPRSRSPSSRYAHAHGDTSHASSYPRAPAEGSSASWSGKYSAGSSEYRGRGGYRARPYRSHWAYDTHNSRSDNVDKASEGSSHRNSDYPYHSSRDYAYGGSYTGRGRGRGRGGYGFSGAYSSGGFHHDYQSGASRTARQTDYSDPRSQRSIPSFSPIKPRSSNPAVADRSIGSHRGRTSHNEVKEETQKEKEDQIDWAEVESKARANGLIVPSDIVDEFKRQGHFDLLRRQLLSTLQSSPVKTSTQSDISNLLLSYFKENPQEAAKIAKMGDVRLQQSECMKIIELLDPPRAKISKGETEELVTPPSGPDIMKTLIAQLHSNDNGEEEEGKDAFRSILDSKGKIGKVIEEHIDQLLKDEIKEAERRVASPTPLSAGAEQVKQEGATEPKEEAKEAKEEVKEESKAETTKEAMEEIEGETPEEAKEEPKAEATEQAEEELNGVTKDQASSANHQTDHMDIDKTGGEE
ncbi:unnamed protein product [Sympodiomycopsis kandeliae]